MLDIGEDLSFQLARTCSQSHTRRIWFTLPSRGTHLVIIIQLTARNNVMFKRTLIIISHLFFFYLLKVKDLKANLKFLAFQSCKSRLKIYHGAKLLRRNFAKSYIPATGAICTCSCLKSCQTTETEFHHHHSKQREES